MHACMVFGDLVADQAIIVIGFNPSVKGLGMKRRAGRCGATGRAGNARARLVCASHRHLATSSCRAAQVVVIQRTTMTTW